MVGGGSGVWLAAAAGFCWRRQRGSVVGGSGVWLAAAAGFGGRWQRGLVGDGGGNGDGVTMTAEGSRAWERVLAKKENIFLLRKIESGFEIKFR